MPDSGWSQTFRPDRLLLTGLTVIAFATHCVGCADDHAQREARLIAQIDSLRTVIDSTQKEEKTLEWKARRGPISDYEIRSLERMGLADPHADLANDLRDHPELIPLNPVPDGESKFGFYDPEGIYLLTPRWVLAEFDDGHGVGHMLLQFSIEDSARIVWKPLAWSYDD
jgi:hypothetical protein